MTQGMVERVARALKPDAMNLPVSDPLHAEGIALARAAIAALRFKEHTPGTPWNYETELLPRAMVIAAENAPYAMEVNWIRTNEWNAMIDAALTEQRQDAGPFHDTRNPNVLRATRQQQRGE